MNLDDFDWSTPFFSQADAADLTQADNDTIDNWVRYKHVVPSRIGKRRMFSFLDLLRIELGLTMARTFGAEIGPAMVVATEAAKSCRDYIQTDWLDILSGTPWARLMTDRGDFHCTLMREADGSLRAFEPGDLEADSVMVVVPARLVERRLLQAVKDWSERSA